MSRDKKQTCNNYVRKEVQQNEQLATELVKNKQVISTRVLSLEEQLELFADIILDQLINESL